MRKPNHGLGRWRSALATTAMLSLAAGVASAQTVTIRSGTMIEGKLDTAITTKVARPGDPVAIRTTEALRIDQWTTLPAGLVLRGEITESRRGGRVRTPPKIAMTFTQLEFDGETYDIATEPFVVRGKSGTSNTLKKVGIGAVAGAVVGGAAGGGSGAVKAPSSARRSARV